jgi:transcriptional regulator with XRE-family HTH domain
VSWQNGSAGTTGTRRSSGGVVAGQVLRALRESIGFTQEQLAESLGVDLNTVKGWETGRRPLLNASGRTLLGLRQQLLKLGASPPLIHQLEPSMEADAFLDQVLAAADVSLLGSWVSTRRWNELIAWAVAGVEPRALRNRPSPADRRRAAPTAPELPSAQRARFFSVLRAAAEQSLVDADVAAVLLRRQIYYMAAWDNSPTGRQWLTEMERAELRRLRRRPNDGWTPEWVGARSLAVARSCQGEPDLLRRFIALDLDDDVCEAANLNYWAYWSGEGPAVATEDAFMASYGLARWRGDRLLAHLTQGLASERPYVELTAHSVCSLIRRRPYLLADDLALTNELGHRTARLLDTNTDLPATARQALENIHFAVRMARDSSPGRTG